MLQTCLCLPLTLILGLLSSVDYEALADPPRPVDSRITAPVIDEARLKQVIAAVTQWSRDPFIIAQVKAQNGQHAHLTQGDIAGLDAQWHMESASDKAPTIAGLLAAPLSLYLARLKAQRENLYTEIIVMDDKGLNVGVSGPTSDYWQGDEAKFLETYGKTSGTPYLSEVEFDISSQSFQIQLSLPITQDGQAIGALTVGLNAEEILPPEKPPPESP
ncbi:hypothetical protein [Rhodospirillum sp. A1_3_36]|uniref:hypothetical protein n=1 Tax=Rhodospirillum sp. A1_3_36 TaxID=3391666 RepID=UPI0039A74138